MREELRLEVEVEGLLWDLENFLMNLLAGSDLYNAKGVIQTQDELGTKLRHRWQPLDSLRGLDIKPTFLYDVLPELPDVPNYIVHWDTT